MFYSGFFETLHDEKYPVGKLGRGTHYSVFRAATWHDASLFLLPTAQLLDFAVIWDEDHDIRVITVIENLYFEGLLAPIKFIGERKGCLTVLVSREMADASCLPHYSQRVKTAVKHSSQEDFWTVTVDYVAGQNSIIAAEAEKVSIYLQNIDNLWNLGPKARSNERRDSAPAIQNLRKPEPSPEHICRSIAPDEVLPSCRDWRGDDEKGGHRHNGAVRLQESPLDIQLRWGESENSPTKLIGHYRLDLNTLLTEGYIRKDSKPGHVRLQFVHDDGGIYIQHRAEKRLFVGVFG